MASGGGTRVVEFLFVVCVWIGLRALEIPTYLYFGGLKQRERVCRGCDRTIGVEKGRLILGVGRGGEVLEK